MMQETAPTPWSFTWIDRAGLALAAAVLGVFFLIWALLMFVAGAAPTHHLSLICLAWFLKAEGFVVLPVWCCARAVRLLVQLLGAEPEVANPPVRRPAAPRAAAAPSSEQADIWAAG